MAPRTCTHRVTLALLLALGGCGGEAGPAGPGAIEGQFLQTIGSRNRVFSLSSDEMVVTCRPKPGLGELTFEAAATTGATTGDFLRFTIKEYTVPKTYELEYSASEPYQKAVEVGLESSGKKAGESDFLYTFFQHHRSDINVTYHSRCSITLHATDNPPKTVFDGLLSCIMLWADFDSPDYEAGTMNNFIDVTAKFACES